MVQDYSLYVPNTFSPNGDGRNELFTAKGTGIKQCEVFIFNRWGEQIYTESSNGLGFGWDGTYKGKKAQEDTYVYIITGIDFTNKEHRKTGIVNLIR